MEKLFVSLLNMSITAGWIVMALLILRPLIKKLPKWVGCTLWALVGIRLLLPLSFESVFSLIPSVETIPSDIAMQRNPAVHTGISSLNSIVNPMISQSFAPPTDFVTSVNPLQIVEFVMSNVWVVGIVAMLLYAAISFVSLKMKLRTATMLEKGVFESEAAQTPFILGKTIYLPYNLSSEEREYCILHEKAHIKRGDHLVKPFAFLLLSVYWFNPLMWVAFVLLCRDIELACDEKVIKELGETERREYSLALVKNSVQRRRIAACPLAFGEVGVKERVKKVMNYKKPAFWVIVVAVVLSAVLAVCLLTNPAGMRLYDIDNNEKLLENVESIVVMVEGESESYYGSYALKIVDALKALRLEDYPVSESRSEERDGRKRMVINSVGYPVSICFNDDCTEVYINDGVKPSFSYKVKNPEKIREYFDSGYVDGILRILSTGSDVDGISISMVGYNFGKKPYIKIKWQNDTNEDFVIGEHFDLLYSDGMSNSYSCAKDEVVFKDIAWIIPAHNSYTMTYSLSQFDVSNSGYYTFKVNFNGAFWADFILDYGSFYQDDIIEIKEIEDDDCTKLYMHGNALSPISSIRFVPIFCIDSKEEFVNFANEYSFISFKDEGFLSILAEHTDENIFDDYSFLLSVVTNSQKPRVGEFYVSEEGMRLSLYTEMLQEKAVSNWLVITPVQKRQLNDTELTAVLWNERVYYYYLSPDPFPASLGLSGDGTANFYYSTFSSYLNIGTYTNDGEKIVMTTDDNLYHFTFIIDGEKLIFDAKNSSELQRFRYESGGEAICPVPDGAVFE